MDLMALLENTHTAGWFLNLSFQSLLIAALGWGLVKLFKRMSAPVRSGIGLATMMVLLLLPVWSQIFHLQKLTISRINTVRPVIGAGLSGQRTAGESKGVKADEPASHYPGTQADTTKKNGRPDQYAAQKRSLWTGANIVLVVNGLAIFWLIGFLFSLFRFSFGLVYLKGFRRGVLEIQGERIGKILQAAQKAFGTTKIPKLYTSPTVDSPLSVGVITPCIIIPHELYQKINPGELKSLFFHEMAHIHHRDHLVGILQRIVAAFNWWNPLVYSVSVEFSRAREYVSDNYAIRENSSSGYARCLLNLAKKTNLIARIPASIGMATPYITLEDRIKHIISKERKMNTNLKKPAIFLIAVCSIILTFFLTGYQWNFASDTHPGTDRPGYKEDSPISSLSSQPEQDDSIHEAAARDEREKVKMLLAAKPGLLNDSDKKGFTPLHIAVIKGQKDIALFLIEKGADMNTRNHNGLTPLFSALDLGLGSMAQLLIEKGADVSITGYRKRTMLHMAARCGDTESARALIKKGLDINAGDSRGATPLHLAAESRDGNIHVARLLLENGADVNPKDNEGNIPLFNAALRGHKDLVGLLVKNGGDVNARGTRITAESIKEKAEKLKKRNPHVLIRGGKKVKMKDIRDTTEIMLSEVIVRGYNDIARILLENGADVNAVDEKGKTPLYYAQKYEHKEVIQLLTTRGARLNQ
jgi:ankyrin repeat protein/beta-lactamase regulating signal transducer with metallopeptidase domain